MRSFLAFMSRPGGDTPELVFETGRPATSTCTALSFRLVAKALLLPIFKMIFINFNLSAVNIPF